MEKKSNKTKKESLEEWMVELREKFGRDLVVSFMVSEAGITFLRCSNKSWEMEDGAGDEPDYPNMNMKEFEVSRAALHDLPKHYSAG